MLLGWYVEQNLGDMGKYEIPPQVPKNHVPIIFCIVDKDLKQLHEPMLGS